MTFKTVAPFQNSQTNSYTAPYGQVVFSFGRLDKKDETLMEQHAASPCLEFLYAFADTLWNTKHDGRNRHTAWWNPADTGKADPDPDKFRIFARYKHCNDAPIEAFIQNIVTILNPIEHTLGIEPTTTELLDIPRQRVMLLTADHRLHNTCLSFSLWANIIRSLMNYTTGDWCDHVTQHSVFRFIEHNVPAQIRCANRGRMLLAWIELWPKLIKVKPTPWTGLPAAMSAGHSGVGTFGCYQHVHYSNEWAKSDLGQLIKKEVFTS